MKETLKKLITEFWEYSPEYIKRTKIPNELMIKKPSLVITGPRRAGKSYMMHEIRQLLIAAGPDKKDFIYLNFEDERLTDFKKEDFDESLESYYEMREPKPTLLFDEIQNVPGWEQFLRRAADGGYKVIATGSNSQMLSREIAEKLGGRFVELRIYPLDFLEFLKFKGIQADHADMYSKERFRIRAFFDEYLQYGGFPEVATLSDPQSKLKVLRTYFDLVFYKDLIARKGLANEEILNFIIKKIREATGNILTPRAIYSAIKDAGLEAGPNTVEKYLDYLEEGFLVLTCPPFSKSVKKQEQKKRYILDTGYMKLFEVKEDQGIMLETLVFVELIKKEKMVGFHHGKKECDFVVDKKTAVQVTLALSGTNQGRELEGLVEAMEAYGLDEGMIVTYEQEKTIDYGGKKIRIVPAWKWFLEL